MAKGRLMSAIKIANSGTTRAWSLQIANHSCTEPSICNSQFAILNLQFSVFRRACQGHTFQGLRHFLLVLAILAGFNNCGESADWTDSRIAGPFICQADFSLSRTGLDGVLDSFASLQTDLVQFLGVAPAKEPIEIFLFHDKATYTAYLKRYVPSVPNRKAVYVKGQGPGRVFAYRSANIEVDLRHECTHALLHASLPLVPLWLDEGLAQFFEVGAARRAGGHPHIDAIRWNVRWGQIPKLQTLESKV